jgi:hypothetical protein
MIAQVIVVGSCCPVQRRGKRHDSDRGGTLVIYSGVVSPTSGCLLPDSGFHFLDALQYRPGRG